MPHTKFQFHGQIAALDAHALTLVRRGQDALSASMCGADPTTRYVTALQLVGSHGRAGVISTDVAQLHPGHANVTPQSLHGDPGRTGGVEELGGLRALGFYHRRSALQASTVVLESLGNTCPT